MRFEPRSEAPLGTPAGRNDNSPPFSNAWNRANESQVPPGTAESEINQW